METLKIIKIGGHIINNEIALMSFVKAFSKLEGPKILVHGGGNLANKLAKRLGVEINMTNGRRITDTETLEIVSMVYAGKINKTIVAKLQAYSCNAMGFSGADGNTIEAVKRPVTPVDFGWVGDIVKVRTELLKVLLEENITPVFSALTHDTKGQLLNTNADTIASQLAIAFAKQYAVELYYCFEKNGVLQDVDDEGSVIENLNKNSFEHYKKEGIISEGMLPKLSNCFDAIAKGVNRICIGKPEMIFNENITCTTIK